MSYTLMNALKSLWNPKNSSQKMVDTWKDYAQAHQALQEQYAKKFSSHIQQMHQHLKKGDHQKVRNLYKEHLNDLSAYFEDSLDAHLKVMGNDPKHVDTLMDHHHSVAQKIVAGLPVSRAIYEKMHDNPKHQRRQRIMSKMAVGSMGMIAGLMTAVIPSKSADASIAVMRGGDMLDLDQAMRARDAIHAKSQRVKKAHTPSKQASLQEMQKVFESFLKNVMQNNPSWLQGLTKGEGKTTNTPNARSSKDTSSTHTLPSVKSKVKQPTVEVEEATIIMPKAPPAPPIEVLEDKGERPKLKTGYIDVLRELKDKFAEKNKRLFQNKDISSINMLAADLEKTATGAYLKFMYPGKDMESSLALAVKQMLKLIQKDSKSKNRIASDSIIKALEDDFEGVQREVIDVTREILKSSVAYGSDYTVFYHGHGNSLRLYLDMLREIKGYETITNLDTANPLRDKGAKNVVSNAQDLLDRYEDEAIKFNDKTNKELKEKDPNAKEVSIFDMNRTLGVGFAPDKIDFFRDHAISANINLFGNMGLLAECTLFYFLDSFNISNPNEFLVKNLLSRITPKDAPEGYVEARMKRYSDLYNQYMKDTGGNLMQIFMKNTPDADTGKNLVDEMTFPSWMKGIPIWESRDTGKIATVSNNFDAVPVLSNKNKLFKKVKTSEYVGLYADNPDAFINKFSNFSKLKKVKKNHRLASLDRAQARIFVDPSTFNDGKNVIVEQHVRKDIDEAAKEAYMKELHQLIQEDMNIYLEGLQKGTAKGQEGDRLTKLVGFVQEGQAFEESQDAYKTPLPQPAKRNKKTVSFESKQVQALPMEPAVSSKKETASVPVTQTKEEAQYQDLVKLQAKKWGSSNASAGGSAVPAKKIISDTKRVTAAKETPAKKTVKSALKPTSKNQKNDGVKRGIKAKRQALKDELKRAPKVVKQNARNSGGQKPRGKRDPSR